MSDRSANIFYVALILLLALTGVYNQAQRGLHADDDNLFLYFAAQKMIQPAAGLAMENKVIDAAQDQGASVESILRLKQRRDYIKNYFAPVAAWSAMTQIYQAKGLEDYPAYLGRMVPAMMAVTTLIPWLFFSAVLLFLRRHELSRAFALGLSVIAVLSLWSLFSAYNPLMILVRQDLLHSVKNLFFFIINPGPGFSVFSFTPRNNLIVLTLALFALRWTGHSVFSYMLLIPAFAIHSSMALILTIHLTALDLFQDRATLRNAKILSVLVGGIAYGLWRETLWSSIGGPWTILAFMALFAGFFAYLVFTSRPLEKIHPRLRRRLDLIHLWLTEKPLPFTDVLLLIFFWAASFPPVYLISCFMSPEQNIYFWHQVHGRAISLFASIMICAFSYYAARQLDHKNIDRILLASCSILWLIGFSYTALTKPSPSKMFAAEASQHENFLSGKMAEADYKFISGPGFVFSEPILYYALGQMMTLRNDRQADLRRTAKP